jgi:pimeloyl-ACP methyl ester carboxylesterase
MDGNTIASQPPTGCDRFMRAIQPTDSGLLHLGGFQIGYEAFGDPARPAVLLLPPWQIVHSRIWKMQVPALARSFRVVTFDAPGTGRSVRSTDPAAYEFERVARQGLGVLDHLGIQRASMLGVSRSCAYCIWLAATVPERVARIVLIANLVTPDGWGTLPGAGFFERCETWEGWQKYNAHYWREHYDEWLTFFFTELFPEPHSTQGIEDGIGWGRETTAEILIQSVTSRALLPALPAIEAIARVNCPVLILHGDRDDRAPIAGSQALAAARPDWQMVTLEGSGHVAIVRDPVRVNLLIQAFLSATPSYAEGR